MLNELDQENWEHLQTLSGNAKHIPAAVRGLLSENSSEFDQAYWKIENHAVVQGDLYSVAAILPKYLEAVVIEAKYKSGVLELLFQIGNGVSLDSGLEDCCYKEVVAVLERLLKHPAIINSGLAQQVQEDLNDLRVLHEERKNDT